MPQFASDSFSGTEGTELTSYSAAWTLHTSYTGKSEIASDRLRQSNSTASCYYHSATPASADYNVESDFFTKQAGGGLCYGGVVGRLDTSANTMYFARHNPVSGWQLLKAVSGTFTQLGASVATSLADETAYNIRLEMIGTAIKVYLDADGTPIISQTDGSITAAGKAGYRISSSGTPGDAVDIHFDNFSADEVAAGAYTLVCAAGAYTYTGQSATLSVNHSLTCSAGSYSYTGVAATLTVAHNLVCATGAYTYSGVSAALSVKHSLACAAGIYTYSGVSASLSVTHSLSCDAGSYSYAGVDTTLTYIPGDGTVDYVLTCAAGAYTCTGQAATLSVSHSLSCEAGAYSYSGVSASLQIAHGLTCSAGAYDYTGSSATLSVNRSLACATGAYDYIGNTATLDYLSGTASISYALTCAVGAYAYTGQAATLTVVGSWSGEIVNLYSPIAQKIKLRSYI